MNGAGRRTRNTSLINARNHALLSTVGVILAAMVMITLGPFIPIAVIRVPVVLSVALLGPGYAFVTAAFGRHRPTDMATLVALSALLSMALFCLLAVGLSFLSLRITPSSVIIGMDIIVGALVLGIVVRDHLGAESMTEPAHGAVGRDLPHHASDILTAGMFALILCVAMVVVALAQQLLPKVGAEPYSQFYLARQWTHVYGPLYVPPGTTASIAVGISNQTQRLQSYTIFPVVGTNHRWGTHTVSISPGRNWIGQVSGQVPMVHCLLRVHLLLYQQKRHNALSSLTVWLKTSRSLPRSCVSVGTS